MADLTPQRDSADGSERLGGAAPVTSSEEPRYSLSLNVECYLPLSFT